MAEQKKKVGKRERNGWWTRKSNGWRSESLGWLRVRGWWLSMWDRWIIKGGMVAEGESWAAKVRRMLESKASERVKSVAIRAGSLWQLTGILTSPQYQQMGDKSSELPASNTLLAAKEISE